MVKLIRKGTGDQPPSDKPKKTPPPGFTGAKTNPDGGAYDNYSGKEERASIFEKPMVNATLFTPEVETKLLIAAESGLDMQKCAEYAGVSRAAVMAWREASKRGDDPRYADLEEKLIQARARGAFSLIDTIRGHSSEDWRAAQALLKMMFGYSEKESKDVNVKVEKQQKVVVVPAKMTSEEWIAQETSLNEGKEPPAIEGIIDAPPDTLQSASADFVIEPETDGDGNE